MKPRVKINGRSSYREWEPGDTGVVDGYCRGGNDIPYAVVILDKNFRFVKLFFYTFLAFYDIYV